MTAYDDAVADRLQAVRDRIARAGGSDVDVLPVTKSFPIEACWAAYHAGCAAVGENYAQEVVAKFAAAPLPFAVHFIGQLQTNKVKMLAPVVSLYGAVDRVALVQELAKRAPGARVLVQVAAVAAEGESEVGKAGCALVDVPALVEAATAVGLRVEGLMAVGPTRGGPQAARATFRAVRALVSRLGLATCSMGMSEDLEVAVEEGTTQVRIGTALFGERPHLGSALR
ncbi:MAG: YggS family pyridoxal phosphate-dependent enzyme [Actinobacteria bacterium]|nr:YggS family pyridoxal phosphate-dependent enzyme [Actinomycetota bacterium]